MIGSLELAAAKGARPQASLRVPLSAIVQAGAAGYGVYVVTGAKGGETATLRPVEIGPVIGTDITVVRGPRGRRRGDHRRREPAQGRPARGDREVKTNETEGSGNIARFFVHNRQIGWVALVATLLWGVFGYMNMPKRKDPDIPVRIGLAICPWPGIASDKVEQLVTRKIEQAATGNSKVERVESTTQDNISVVQVRLLDSIKNTDQEFQDIGQRLKQIEKDLPDGAGPITWISDFGDTAALMLTVASPPVPGIEIELGARGIREAIEKERRGEDGRVTVLYCYPASVSPAMIERPFRLFADQAQRDGMAGTSDRCRWAAAPVSTSPPASRTPRCAPLASSSWTGGCRSPTSIPTRGARS